METTIFEINNKSLLEAQEESRKTIANIETANVEFRAMIELQNDAVSCLQEGVLKELQRPIHIPIEPQKMNFKSVIISLYHGFKKSFNCQRGTKRKER